MKNKLVWVGLVVFVMSMLRISPARADYTFENATKRTNSAISSVYNPQFQATADKIYYTWNASISGKWQIWTAEMNTDGTGWNMTQRTSSAYDKKYPQLQIVGTKIYYTWYEYDGAKWQIWTAEMNTDGTGWTATKRTTTAYDKQYPQFQVEGTKIYYTWYEPDSGIYQIWTAEMNTDGTGWTATKRTTTNYRKYNPQLRVVSSKIYYTWDEYDGTNEQIWTAEMNTDGTGWTATKRTTTPYAKQYPQLQVAGTKIYYTWYEQDGAKYQIWTAAMNIDGTGWTATKQTISAYHKYNPQLQVVDNKIYYTWYESDGTNDQIWTAEMNTDGTGWTATKQTTTTYFKNGPQFQVLNSKFYYTWYESDGMYWQLWTADGSETINNPIPTLKSTLSNSKPSDLVDMTMTFEPSITTPITNGSIKLNFDENFDFTGLTKDDVVATGGDVTWSANEIVKVDGVLVARNVLLDVFKAYAAGEDSIVFPFTGTLDYTDKPITFTINGATNPGTNGSYGFDVGIYGSADGTGNPVEMKNGKVAINDSVTVTATVPSSLTFTVNGVASGNACANSGGNAAVTSTSTAIPFGTYAGAQTKIACQTLTVSTNATDGYIVTVQQNRDMTSAGSDTMAKFAGTYALPTVWATPPGSGTESYFGLTTNDTDYAAFQTAKYTKFAANDTPYNIATGAQPVVNETNVVSYQLEVTNLQPAGTYSNVVMYIATATF